MNKIVGKYINLDKEKSINMEEIVLFVRKLRKRLKCYLCSVDKPNRTFSEICKMPSDFI